MTVAITMTILLLLYRTTVQFWWIGLTTRRARDPDQRTYLFSNGFGCGVPRGWGTSLRHIRARARALALYAACIISAHDSVCVSICVCVCMCVCERESVRAAVSTARIGMSGMIGIEFFKNAFSPGTVRQRWCRAGDSRPARHLVANTRDITAAADRGEVTTVLPRASPPA